MTAPDKAIEYIFTQGKRYAKAKAERIYLEEFRKSLKAMLMQRSKEQAVNAQERDAYSDPEYVKLLEELRWGLTAAQAKIEVWRTEQANARAEGRAI